MQLCCGATAKEENKIERKADTRGQTREVMEEGRKGEERRVGRELNARGNRSCRGECHPFNTKDQFSGTNVSQRRI